MAVTKGRSEPSNGIEPVKPSNTDALLESLDEILKKLQCLEDLVQERARNVMRKEEDEVAVPSRAVNVEDPFLFREAAIRTYEIVNQIDHVTSIVHRIEV